MPGAHYLCCLIIVFLSFCRRAEKPATIQPTSAVQRGVKFLLQQQREDGAIFAGANEAEDSAVASTAYAILACLRALPPEALPAERIARAQAYLLAQQSPEGLWRYKPFLPPDLDDTAAAIGALGFPNVLRQEAQRAIEAVFALQQPNGSIPTWLIEKQTSVTPATNYESFVGMADPEVVAFFLTQIAAAENNSARVLAAAGYLVQQLPESGLYKSRWYSNPYYATFRVAQALLLLEPSGQKYERTLLALQKRVLRERAQWDSEGSVLSRAFALGILHSTRVNVCEAHQKSYQAIIAAQGSDGSWPPEALFLTDSSQLLKGVSERRSIASALYSTALIVEILSQLHCTD
jgi:squalene cyclase